MMDLPKEECVMKLNGMAVDLDESPKEYSMRDEELLEVIHTPKSKPQAPVINVDEKSEEEEEGEGQEEGQQEEQEEEHPKLPPKQATKTVDLDAILSGSSAPGVKLKVRLKE